MRTGWFLWAYDGSGCPLRCRVTRNDDGTYAADPAVTDATALRQVALGGDDHFTPDGEPTDNEPISDALWR